MEKQQTLRRQVAGADSSSAENLAQKSLAAQPRAGVPHRILDQRNRITAGESLKAQDRRPARSAEATPRRKNPSPPSRQ